MPDNNPVIVNQIDTAEEVEVEKDKMAGIRKLIIAGVVLLVGSIVAHFKGDIPPNMLQLLEVLFGGFIVGNVTEHVVGSVKSVAEIKHAPQEYSIAAVPAAPAVDTELRYSVANMAEGLELVKSVADRTEESLAKQTEAINIIQQTLLMIIQKAGLDK